MGNYWLHDLPAALQNRGLEVEFQPNWETRSRSSGGLEEILGVGTHHDAFPAGFDFERRCAYAWYNAAARPIGNAFIRKNGVIRFGAAGATNTQGRSERDHVMSKGIIPQSKGNLYMISYEAENNGVGEIWPEEQLEAYELACAATCDLYDLNPVTDILHHWQYTTRKIDPFGPTVGRTYGPQKWTDGFQRAVSNITFGDDMVIGLDDPPRLFDSRTFMSGAPFKKGVHTMPVSHITEVPATARNIFVNVTAVPVGYPGHATLWSGRNTKVPNASQLNYTNVPVANTTLVKLHNRSFKIYVASDTHLVFDVVGYS